MMRRFVSALSLGSWLGAAPTALGSLPLSVGAIPIAVAALSTTVAIAVVARAAPAAEVASDLPVASFDFRNVAAANALRLIAAQFGYSIVIGEGVSGVANAKLSNVTFEEALRYMAAATGCEYLVQDRVLMVNPSERMARVFRLQYIDPATAAPVVAKVLSSGGQVEPFTGRGKSSSGDATTVSSSLLVTDTPTRLDKVEQLLHQIDVRPKLIAIEARLVETTLGADEKMGLDWQIRASANGAALPNTFPIPKRSGSGDLTGTPNPTSSVAGGGHAFPPGETFPYTMPSDYTFGKLSFQEFNLALDILKQSSHTNLVSAPKVTTLDNQEAEIVVGTVVPIAIYERLPYTGTLEITGYDEKKVGVRLLVTPHVGPDSTIILSVKPEISEIVEYRGQFNERPVTSTRSATTHVDLRSGETIMIGGLIKNLSMTTERKVPLLGDIPVIKYLFRHKTKSDQKVDLMIFVTPHLLD
jgi:type II secretory pathway component GspD/PulD (secretin)